MCGRFTLTMPLRGTFDPANLQETFRDYTFPQTFAPRFNIAPSQPVLAIPNDGQNRADFFLWGLIPSWAKYPSIGRRLINARSETLTEKPAFRGAFKYKRCLILADGFYEWQTRPGAKAKMPYFISLKERRPFAFAGLWDEWLAPGSGPLKTCLIITTQPNELMIPLHHRMPVILRPDDYAQWLNPAPQTPENLLPLLRPYPADEMTAHPVSTLVNHPQNDCPECLLPA
ncbi:MAG: SOS response-associated peptidase [Anaerolineales bacterium]